MLKKNKRLSCIKLLLSLLLTGESFLCFCQKPPNRLMADSGTIAVFTTQNMAFGAFSQGASGGTVIISADGTQKRFRVGRVDRLGVATAPG